MSSGELTTVFSYLLVGHNPTFTANRRAALTALIVTTFGGLAMLVGIVLLTRFELEEPSPGRQRHTGVVGREENHQRGGTMSASSAAQWSASLECFVPL